MKTLKELREQQARIATEARAKWDEIKGDTPEDRGQEIEREFDKMMADHDALGARAERLEKLERAERSAKSEPDPRRPNAAGESPGADEGAVVPNYREAFHAMLRAQGNEALLSVEQRAALRAGYASIGAEERAQTAGTDAAGGYLVPTELANILVKSMAAYGPMYDDNVTTVLTTTGGGQIDIPTVDDTAVAAGTHTEGATLADTGAKDVTFGLKSLNAYAYNTEFLRISKELVDDSFFVVEQVIGSLLGERLARIANTKLTTGTGSGEPNGIVTASALGKTAAGTAALTADEIMDLLHSVDPAYREAPGSVFMFNDSTLSAIRKLKDGNGNYLWQMGNVQQGVPGNILGYRYHINQAMDALAAAKKVVLFGDFGKYFVRKVGGPLVGAVQDKDFWPGFGMAGYVRFDGELTDTAAVKHLITAAV